MNLKNLDLNLLRTFDALMRAKSVTAAADELRVTQPTMSNALSRLRDASGDQLLERIGNQMVPTQYARDLWPFIRQAMNSIESGIESVNHFDPIEFSGTFRIGMDAYCVSFIAPNLAARIFKEAPSAKIEILPAPPHQMEEEMLRDRCDLIIGPMWRKNKSLKEKVLFVEEFALLLGRHHPLLAQPGLFTPESYAATSHVVYSERGFLPGLIDRKLTNMGLVRNSKVSVPFYPAIGGILQNTDCVSSLGRALAHEVALTADLMVIDLPFTPPTFEVAMLWAPRNEHAKSHQWLRQLCAEVARSSAVRTKD